MLQVPPSLALAVELAEKTAAEEGRDIVLSMLVVGLVFLGVVVALGDLGTGAARKRRNAAAAGLGR